MIFDIVGVLEFLILGESGRRAADGNFGWGMMGAALMMWVVAMIRFASAVRQERTKDGRLRPRHITGTLLLGWHLVSGVYYIAYLFTSGSSL